jgi:hypothetical protein
MAWMLKLVCILLLLQVAASKAGTIIVLHPDSASSAQNAEAIKASVAMCITALGPQSNQRVVVQATGALPGVFWHAAAHPMILVHASVV